MGAAVLTIFCISNISTRLSGKFSTHVTWSKASRCIPYNFFYSCKFYHCDLWILLSNSHNLFLSRNLLLSSNGVDRYALQHSKSWFLSQAGYFLFETSSVSASILVSVRKFLKFFVVS